jgi:transposase
MAAKRLLMRKIREILRLKHDLGRSHRHIAAQLGISVGSVSEVARRAGGAGLGWPLPADLDDAELERRLYGQSTAAPGRRPLPVWSKIHQELKRVGVTLQLLWLEYREDHADGYQYTQFCEHYRRWRKSLRSSMRQTHRAGDKLFLDYSGKRPEIVDPRTGEVRTVELFVAVLGASGYTYAEATPSQKLRDWVASNARALEFFGGVPGALVPDCLRSAVTRGCRYEPEVNLTYQGFAEHYGTSVLPARPRKPKDKAKVEVGVQVIQRWILARLRNRIFFSIEELNEAIWELLDEVNDRPYQKLGVSRAEMFETIDRPALRPLPAERYHYTERRYARVNIDYHVEFDRHYYSVPYQLAHEQVEVRATESTIEVIHRHRRVASHRRSYRRGQHTTDPAHMPSAHRRHAEWTPSRIVAWAETIGTNTAELAVHILRSRRHPEQGYRSCLGIMRLVETYGPERLEKACARALRVDARSYKSVKAILKGNLDQAPVETNDRRSLPRSHANLRGREYYQ